MDVYFNSQIGICTEYRQSETSKKQDVSVVIAPIKVEMTEQQLKVISGCNMWRSCMNKACYYSLKARTGDKVGKV